MIPSWVVKLLEKAKADAWTGTLSIVYRSGEPRHARREEVIQAPFEPQQGKAMAVSCPQGCGPMQDKDYNNLWVCSHCGTKRTRAQLMATESIKPH